MNVCVGILHVIDEYTWCNCLATDRMRMSVWWNEYGHMVKAPTFTSEWIPGIQTYLRQAPSLPSHTEIVLWENNTHTTNTPNDRHTMYMCTCICVLRYYTCSIGKNFYKIWWAVSGVIMGVLTIDVIISGKISNLDHLLWSCLQPYTCTCIFDLILLGINTLYITLYFWKLSGRLPDSSSGGRSPLVRDIPLLHTAILKGKVGKGLM